MTRTRVNRGNKAERQRPIESPQLLTQLQAAEILQVELGTLENWRSAGRGPSFVKVGRLVRYRAEDLEAWINANLKKNDRQLV